MPSVRKIIRTYLYQEVLNGLASKTGCACPISRLGMPFESLNKKCEIPFNCIPASFKVENNEIKIKIQEIQDGNN